MATEYPIDLVQGVPFYRRFRFSLEDEAGVRTAQDISAMEVRGAIKSLDSKGQPKTLQLDLTTYLTKIVGQTGVFDLDLPGSATRQVTKEGRYDVFISEVGVADVEAYRPLLGPVTVELAVTDAE